jgi:hypothetical protein
MLYQACEACEAAHAAPCQWAMVWQRCAPPSRVPAINPFTINSHSCLETLTVPAQVLDTLTISPHV